MVHVIKNAKEIANAYNAELLASKETNMLTQETFTSMAASYQPVALVKAEEDGSLGDLMGQAVEVLKLQVEEPIPGIIVSVAYRTGDEIDMDERSAFMELTGTLFNDETDLDWGIHAQDALPSRRTVSIYAFK